MPQHRTRKTCDWPQKSDALRIGLFSESFQPVQNGVTTSVLTLIAGLRERNHRVCVFAPEHQNQAKEPGVMRFPSFVSSLNPEYPLAYPFLPRLALAAHFDRLRLDIVHTHTPFVMGLTGAKLALRRDVPLVATFHTLYSQYSHYVPVLPESVTTGLLEHYLPWYYNRAAEIICPSRVAEQHLRELNVERPITVIPTGIPLPPPLEETTRQRLRERIGVGADTPLMLYAGRLAKEKNVGLLLEIFARVRERVPNACLAIAGSGPMAEELQAAAEKLAGGESIRFLGPIPRCQMDALYAAADVFCFPSPSETQGLVIGEARAAGTPCVVVNAGGAPETVRQGEDGFCVSPEEPVAFAEAVAQILQNAPLRERLRENARRNAQDFTPQRMVERVLEVYECARLHAPRPIPAAPPLTPDALNWQAVGQAVRERGTDGVETPF